MDSPSFPFDGTDVKPAAGGMLSLSLDGFFLALLTYVSSPILEDPCLNDTKFRNAGTNGSDKHTMMTTTSSMVASNTGEQPEEKNDGMTSYGGEKGEKDMFDGIKRAGGGGIEPSPSVSGSIADTSNEPISLSHLVAHHFMLQTSRALVRLLMNSSVTASIREEAAAGG